MERIKQALEKARQERQGQTVFKPPAGEPAGESEGKSAPLSARVVTVDESVLERNRIITGNVPSDFLESYKMLRTQVLQRLKENNWNVLGVTSPGPGEGKSITAINLAISIAQEVDYTVMLVCATLRNTELLNQLGLPQLKGLSNYLVDDVPINELLVSPSIAEHLVILPAGDPIANSSEMLSSDKMANLIREMKSSYHSHVIIFDLPPVLETSDTLSFSPNLDAVLIVIEDGATQEHDLQTTIDLLSNNTNIIGTILNKAN